MLLRVGQCAVAVGGGGGGGGGGGMTCQSAWPEASGQYSDPAHQLHGSAGSIKIYAQKCYIV